MVRVEWVMVMFMALALAGCTGDDTNDVVGEFRDELDSQETEPTNNETLNDEEPATTGTDDEDNPPAPGTINVSLSADVLGGPAPLTVTFTIAAEALDASGAAVTPNFTWALFSEDEAQGFETSGEGLPATANLTFELAGNYTMIAGVSADGFDDGFANVTVSATSGGVVQTSGPEKWFLYYPAPGGACGDPIMSRQSGGEDSGCRALTHPANIVVGTVTDVTGPLPEIGDAWTQFDADVASSGHAPGSIVEGTYGWFSAGLGTGTFDWELFADGQLVAGDSETVDFGPGFGATQYDFDGETTAEIPDGAMLSFRYRIMSGDYYESSGYDRYLTISPA